MFPHKIWHSIFAIFGLVIAVTFMPPGVTRAADSADQPDPKLQARRHWEDVVQFYGDEETGEWSLRIQDKDVHNRGWFEFLELWHYNRDEKRWEQLKTGKIAKAIVLPNQKTSDEPKDTEMLIELKDIEPKTAGIWYAKWKIDDIECSTPMRVGGGRATNKLEGPTPHGMVKLIVPITLDKSENMFIPDPQIYCVYGGPGKPEAKDAKK